MPVGVYLHSKGRKHSEETKYKISLANTGKKYHLGKQHSDKTKQRISLSKKGGIPWNKGKVGEYKLSDETREKMRLAHLGKKRKYPSRIPDYFLKYGRLRTPEWVVVRNQVYKRDNWTCQICGKKCHNGRAIQCHHIVPFRITQDNGESNLITLCRSCHMAEEHRYYRKKGVEKICLL